LYLLFQFQNLFTKIYLKHPKRCIQIDSGQFLSKAFHKWHINVTLEQQHKNSIIISYLKFKNYNSRKGKEEIDHIKYQISNKSIINHQQLFILKSATRNPQQFFILKSWTTG